MATDQQNTKPLTTRTGWVSRVTGKDTINVELRTLVKHGMYGKYLRHRTRLLVHDPGNQAQQGDQVEITECRPISKSKSWRLVRVVRRAEL